MTADPRIRVAVVGAGGRMGATVCEAVGAASDLVLVAAVDPAAAGTRVMTEAGTTGTSDGLVVDADLDAVTAAGADVVVDFTVVDAARATLAWCASRRIHAVVGTTGFTPRDFDEISGWFPSDGSAGCIVAPNFAIGAVLMMRLAELAAPWFATGEIVELHHDAKRDAPSGTALRTAERMAAARHAAGQGDWADDPTTTEVVAGARGGVGPAGLHLHAVRLRGLVAHQEVLLGTTGETLTIRHDSHDRRSFMPGVLLAVRAVAGRPGLTVGLDSLLGLE
jgi:4-hydroxy-tetrahydrodipicolinate reductase